MKYTIRFREDSIKDFEDGFIYYKKISIDLANRFHQEFKKRIDEIEQNPLHHQLKYRNIRIVNLKKFPFSIHFIIEAKVIHIIKILHQKRVYK
ncbi:type II toxin-antitoxin system RelE/ParE family toxin [bacterium AH-315-P13]|nr:type II toxin-antitoxin system RelE/ParE family toxin [bacterium AH-315-P13]